MVSTDWLLTAQLIPLHCTEILYTCICSLCVCELVDGCVCGYSVIPPRHLHLRCFIFYCYCAGLCSSAIVPYFHSIQCCCWSKYHCRNSTNNIFEQHYNYTCNAATCIVMYHIWWRMISIRRLAALILPNIRFPSLS